MFSRLLGLLCQRALTPTTDEISIAVKLSHLADLPARRFKELKSPSASPHDDKANLLLMWLTAILALADGRRRTGCARVENERAGSRVFQKSHKLPCASSMSNTGALSRLDG